MEYSWHTKYGQYAVFSPTTPDNVVPGDYGRYRASGRQYDELPVAAA